MGPPGSATWNSILDAAEAILLEEGYAELTSRRIAERISIKQRLVYYYFHTMEDIVVEAFQRMSKRELERLETAFKTELPLHEVWGVCIHTTDSRLISEFMALAHRSEGVRKEVIHFIERSRALQVEALSRAMQNQKGGIMGLPPAAITFMATSIALALTRESQLGISMGHRETERVISEALASLEPVAPSRTKRPASRRTN
jgi:AcrR family transcriptional regulator